MKIVLVDAALDGHHARYIRGICSSKNIDFVLIAPDGDCDLAGVPVYRYNFNAKKLDLFKYFRWLRFIKKIAKKERADAVHFLDGDTVMKFMALGLKRFRKNLFVTYHNFYRGFLRKISYKRTARFSRAIVVHTDTVKRLLTEQKIKNAVRNDYPAFDGEIAKALPVKECKAAFGLPDDKPIVGFVGGISAYKGFDLFLDCLRQECDGVCFFVAGRATDYTKEFLGQVARDNAGKIVIREGWLSNEDYCRALAATDVLLLPYDDNFYGASGPLADGAYCGKRIVTTKGGGIADIVEENHLGTVLKERSAKCLLKEINESFVYDETAKAYAKTVSAEAFVCRYERIYNGESGTEL